MKFDEGEVVGALVALTDEIHRWERESQRYRTGRWDLGFTRRRQCGPCVNGLAYDTATSTFIARAEYVIEYNGEERACHGTLCRTPGGAFFDFQQIEDKDDDGQTVLRYRFTPMNAAAAQKWVLEGDVELLDDSFVEVPEAAAETAEPSATIYVRAPASLKRRVDEAAAAAGLSLNAYMLRCAESCLPEATKAAGSEPSSVETKGLFRARL